MQKTIRKKTLPIIAPAQDNHANILVYSHLVFFLTIMGVKMEAGISGCWVCSETPCILGPALPLANSVALEALQPLSPLPSSDPGNDSPTAYLM